MPIAVPAMVKGLTVDAWTVARPLLMLILLPLAVGMAIHRASAAAVARIRPFVLTATALATIALVASTVAVYGKDLLGLKGSLAVVAQFIFFLIVTVLPYRCGFGLRHEQKIVLSIGMATRNLGAALVPLYSVPDIDQRAVVMVVLGLPVMIGFAFLATKWFGRPAPRDVGGFRMRDEIK